MADFGSARDFYAESKYSKKPLIHFPSVNRPGTVLEFVWKSDHNTTSYYKCNECVKLWKRNRNLGIVPTLTVRDGRIVTDPDIPRNPHFCQPKTEVQALAQQVDRENRSAIRATGKKPRQQHAESLADIPRRFQNKPEAVRDGIQQEMKPFRQVNENFDACGTKFKLRALRVLFNMKNSYVILCIVCKFVSRSAEATTGTCGRTSQMSTMSTTFQTS